MSKARIVFERLAKHHAVKAFTCGNPELDGYLQLRASQDQRRGYATAIVAVRPGAAHEVLGFYTLSTASLNLTDLPEETTQKLPRYGQVPAVLLGRLAVATHGQGKGMGALLLADALQRAYASELAWAFFVVKAKDAQAASFYQHFGFHSLASAPLYLWITRQQVAQLF
ncbi:GNAT family N-acetyltransferase [Desulfovibrio cuneatus]|uniref:GNAT family N-acetyltransferase n=1 Tax=Desulfovibrio cuneatus TaxID=159728 RepID=UPI0004124DB3|nr:GNAT family N-acetyltransferase [Desulfovibrio cuneatus]